MATPSPDNRPNYQAAPESARHLIAISGGRGGVGKSMLVANLGVYLAQLGRNVVVVDADPRGGGSAQPPRFAQSDAHGASQ